MTNSTQPLCRRISRFQMHGLAVVLAALAVAFAACAPFSASTQSPHGTPTSVITATATPYQLAPGSTAQFPRVLHLREPTPPYLASIYEQAWTSESPSLMAQWAQVPVIGWSGSIISGGYAGTQPNTIAELTDFYFPALRTTLESNGDTVLVVGVTNSSGNPVLYDSDGQKKPLELYIVLGFFSASVPVPGTKIVQNSSFGITMLGTSDPTGDTDVDLRNIATGGDPGGQYSFDDPNLFDAAVNADLLGIAGVFEVATRLVPPFDGVTFYKDHAPAADVIVPALIRLSDGAPFSSLTPQQQNYLLNGDDGKFVSNMSMSVAGIWHIGYIPPDTTN